MIKYSKFNFTAGEVMRRVQGVFPTSLGYWESQGWISPELTEKGIKLYTLGQVLLIEDAKELICNGYSIPDAFKEAAAKTKL